MLLERLPFVEEQKPQLSALYPLIGKKSVLLWHSRCFPITVFLGIPSLKTSLWFSFLVFQRILCLRLRRENLVIILSALPPLAPICPSAIWESGKLGSRERKSFAQRWDRMAVARLGPGASLRTSWLFHRPLWHYHCHAELSGGPTLGRPMLVVRVCAQIMEEYIYWTNTMKLLFVLPPIIYQPNYLGLGPELAFAADANPSSLYITGKIPLAIDLRGIWANNQCAGISS